MVQLNETSIALDKAVFAYAKAYSGLWKLAQKYPDKFPYGAINCGSIAEHYAMMYLKYIYPDAIVKFGVANEKGWDVIVTTKNNKNIKYQIKSVSVFNKARRTTEIVKGFDMLIVLGLDSDFFPFQAYLFDDANIFWAGKRIKHLTLPDLNNSLRAKGSVIFQQGKNIKNDFDYALMID